MGCFNLQGFYSNLPITDGDKTVAFICAKYNGPTDYLTQPLYATDYMEPICLPIFGEYNDYGTIENIVPSETTKLIEKLSGMAIDEFIKNIASECNGVPYNIIVEATKEKNRCHYTEEGVIKFFDAVLRKKSELSEWYEKDEANKELKDSIRSILKYEENRLETVSLCVIFELQEVYDSIIEISKSKKSGYFFWSTYKELEQVWDNNYKFCNIVKEKYGVKLNMLREHYRESIFNYKLSNYAEFFKLEKQYLLTDGYGTQSPYNFVCSGGMEEYINALYEHYDGDVNVLKDDYLNYAMFYLLFIRLRGVFNFSTYGGQEFSYLSAIKLKKKELEYLENYVKKWEEGNKDDNTLKIEDYLD